ncbi:hypothetical protein AMST5_03058 [freshwater sediment metagenome]|uniref:Terminase large subunit gp17-like C-terminal domain-containing protein n=1 Tax=freshwater sediment metagenome TaxID=556182 RepID=A0AA48M197_9ZZZZ
MSTDFDDPANWPTSSAVALCVGLDIGIAQDHSALVVGGAWQSGGRQIVGIFQVQQFPLGTPLDEVADFATAIAKHLRCRIVFDSSNNSAFASLLAARLGPNPANALVAGVITNSLDHAAQPTPMQLSLAGQLASIPRWTLSKRELIESVSAEIDSGTLRIGHAGDWEALRNELLGMERTVRQSGSVAYSAPQGKHDDIVMALALCLFGIRRVAAPAGRRAHGRRERFSERAWT